MLLGGVWWWLLGGILRILGGVYDLFQVGGLEEVVLFFLGACGVLRGEGASLDQKNFILTTLRLLLQLLTILIIITAALLLFLAARD